MNNQDFLTYDCKKDKELFNSYVKGLIFPVVIILLLALIYYVDKNNKKEIYNAFINGEEIICDNFIVSKKLGFKFDKNNKYRVSDDKNSFILYNCISKKTE